MSTNPIDDLFAPSEQPFSPEELRELGLVPGGDEQTSADTKPAAGENPAPNAPAPPDTLSHVEAGAQATTTPATPTPDRLAEAVAKLAEFVEAKTAQTQPSTPEPEPVPDVDELIESGNTAEAVRAVKELSERQIQQLTAQQAALLHSYAKELFRQRLGDETFSKWWPKIEQQATAAGVSVQQLVTVDQLESAWKLAKAENLDLVLQEERQKWEQEARTHAVAGGSVGERTLVPPDVDIDPAEFRDARDLGVDPRSWARSRKIIEKTNRAADPYEIREVPLIDDDFTSRDTFGDVVIEPGRF